MGKRESYINCNANIGLADQFDSDPSLQGRPLADACGNVDSTRAVANLKDNPFD